MSKKSAFLIFFVFFFISITFARVKLNHLVNVNNDFSQLNILQNDYWAFWAYYDGLLGNNSIKKAPGGLFTPKKVPVIYTEGIVWGGIVKEGSDKTEIDTPRVGGVRYRVGTQPGHVIRIGDKYEIDPASKRIFKVSKKWQTLTDADLRKELGALLNVDENQIMTDQIAALRQKYANDWKNWPVELGAPFNDINENGIYDPVLDENGYPLPDSGDYPGMRQATQTMFLVINDLDSNKVKNYRGQNLLAWKCKLHSGLTTSIFYLWRIPSLNDM